MIGFALDRAGQFRPASELLRAAGKLRVCRDGGRRIRCCGCHRREAATTERPDNDDCRRPPSPSLCLCEGHGWMVVLDRRGTHKEDWWSWCPDCCWRRRRFVLRISMNHDDGWRMADGGGKRSAGVEFLKGRLLFELYDIMSRKMRRRSRVCRWSTFLVAR